MHVQNTTSATESLIPASEVDCTDAVLTQHGGAHDAWLDSDIEVSLVEDAEGVLGQDAGNGNKLSVSGAIKSAVGLVHASTDDLAVLDKHAAHRRLIARQCKFSLAHVIGQLHIAKRCSSSAAEARVN